MIKKAFYLITHNFGWKCLALFLSFILWFLVMNVKNPVYTKTFNLPLQVDNQDVLENNQYILQNADELKSKIISVKVKASTQTLASLNTTDKNFKAYIDLKPIDISRTEELGKPMDVNVKVELPPDVNAASYEISGYSPSTVSIVLDKIVEENFPITVVKNGDGKTGYVALQSTATPNTVTIRGAKSVLNNIDTVQAVVDLSNATKDITTSVSPVVVDGQGNDMTGQLALSVDQVDIHVVVNKFEKISVATPTLSGNPAEGYYFDSANWEPQTIEVVGSESEVRATPPIVLPTINMENASETFVQRFDVRQYFTNSSLTVKNGTPHEVVVTVVIGKEGTTELEIPMDAITIDAMDAPFVLPEGNLLLRLKGPQDVVDALTPQDIGASINLSGLEAGTHTVPVSLALPADVVVLGHSPTITVEIEED